MVLLVTAGYNWGVLGGTLGVLVVIGCIAGYWGVIEDTGWCFGALWGTQGTAGPAAGYCLVLPGIPVGCCGVLGYWHVLWGGG